MRCKVKITDIETIHEIEGAWSKEDYIELLDRLGFPEAEEAAQEELLELFLMAIGEFESHEAAEIILTYKLAGILTKGQIKNLATEMRDDNVAEEYSDIALHYSLFNINQLLYKAFSSSFPNAKASKVTMGIQFQQNTRVDIGKDNVLKAMSIGLRERNLVRRLFPEQLEGKVEFTEAENIIWEMEQSDDGTISIITSDYWVNEEDFTETEFEGIVHDFEDEYPSI